MRKLSTTFIALCLVLAAISSGFAAADSPATKATVMTGLASMPLAFTENQGQWDKRVLFRADAGGATMWFTKTGAYYQFTRRIPEGESVECTPPLAVGSDRFDHEPDSLETIMIKAFFVGANPNPRMVGENMMEYKCNYFLGNEPDKWRTDVPNYKAVVYEDIYPGIDLKYYGNGKQMEYDFIVSPGADPSQIMVQYEGAKSLSINSAGELVVETDWGEVVEQRPVVYQMSGGDRVALAGEYVLKGDKAFGLELPDGYDVDLPLVIDPTLVYSTYLGGNDYDQGHGIAVDAAGAAYVTGYTNSSDFPTTPNGYDISYNGGYDAFVMKLSATGNLVYSTYLGGNDDDYGYGITVDALGAAYVTGWTYSTDFPTENPYQTYQAYSDVFVTKLSSSGSSLVYSTYLGGSNDDWGHGIAVDASGAAYVTGITYSTDFPTENPYQTYQGSWDVFVTKLSSSGSSLVYSTYLGGNDHDIGYGIAVDASGAAYVTGYTYSTDFPIENPYQTDQGDVDVFVTKLSSSGSSLVYSTYLGGNGNERGHGIAVDAAGAAYVTGYTNSSDFPTTPNGYDISYNGGYDAFVMKLSATGNLVYSTYLGGNDDDYGYGITVDALGAAYVTGWTYSTDFPTENPYQTDQGDGDVFVTKLSSSGSSLVYSTYLGGNYWEGGYDIAVDASGAAYVTGITYSTDFPTENPYQTDQGGTDVFVTKLSGEGGEQYLAEKQSLIDYFNAELFYQVAEPNAQAFIDLVQAHIDAGTVTEKELEAVLRLLLVEEAAKAAYKSSDEIGAVPIANLTARCTHKAATALFMKLLFMKLEKAIEPLKDVFGLKWFYKRVHNASGWFDKTLHSFNKSVVLEISDPLKPMIVAQQGLSQPEARELAMKFGLDFVKAGEQKLAGIALDEVNELLIESKLTELNLWLYESGILIYDPPDPEFDPLYIGGTEPVLQSAVDDAASQEFQEGGTDAIVNAIRNEKIPEIVADNTQCVGFINGTITAGEWAEVTQLIILAVLLIVLIVGLIAAIIGCGPSGGIGCVLAAIAGLGIWGTLLKIQALLSWAKIVVFTLGAGTGAFQLHANLPSQLWDTKHVAFDQAPKVLLVGGSVADIQHYNIPSEWSDSLAAASDSVASRLAIIRSQIVAGDWVGVQGQQDGLDSALDRLSSTSLIASALLGYSYMCNNSDTLEGVDSILHFTMAHGSANYMSLGMAQVALGFASVAEPDGADRDTLLMIMDDCIGKLEAVGPAYESAFGDFDSLGFTVPPVVVIIDYQVTEDDSGKVFESSVKNVSSVPVHKVLARLTCSDSSMAPITPESYTLIDVLGPNEDSLFRWRIEAGESDTLFQLELIIEPDSLPGDFIGDNRIITLYYPSAEYQYICGDVDGSGGNPNVADLTYLVDYLFFEGPPPPVLEAANVDGQGGVNVADLSYLVDYLFFEGPEPICGPIE